MVKDLGWKIILLHQIGSKIYMRSKTFVRPLIKIMKFSPQFYLSNIPPHPYILTAREFYVVLFLKKKIEIQFKIFFL